MAAALLFVLVAARTHAAAGKLNVIASTTLLQSAAREIGGDLVNVGVLIAPGSCPGHYDVRPQDIRALSSSKLVLTHGYESFVHGIITPMGSKKPRLVKISASGNWLIPRVYLLGARQVADALCRADPTHSPRYRASLASLDARVAKLSARLLSDLVAGNARKTSVLCSDQQAPFVKWMGFKVVGTYARAEEFTPSGLHKLTQAARKNRVRIVIDNLQSGPTAGSELAKDIGAAHVTLSNFPGGFAGTTTWSACIQDNVSRVLKGMRHAK